MDNHTHTHVVSFVDKDLAESWLMKKVIKRYISVTYSNLQRVTVSYTDESNVKK